MVFSSIELTPNRHYNQTLRINEQLLPKLLYNLTKDEVITQLSFVWDQKLYSLQETNYIQKQLRNKADGNIPLLLCPDDWDFSCTIVVVKVKHYADHTCWEKIGYVSRENYSFEKMMRSGYMDYSTWTAGDFENYSEDYFFKSAPDIKWDTLWSQVWPEEERRRIWNYLHPFFNDDHNISWLTDLNWTFERSLYDHFIHQVTTLCQNDSL
ncbi:hypothetical protein [Enterococcus sp. LJL51]|uniref:hypothetical protein n=1 Tax=Enterococcus sp. LJL51 TaxID=3416656 RepID=UPI003CF579EA